MTGDHMLPIPLLQERLRALGAPDVLETDLERLSKGRFGESLEFLLEHIQGRNSVKNSRGSLYSLQDEKHRSSLRNPRFNNALAEEKAARSNMHGARHDMTELYEALSKRQKSLADLENEAIILKKRTQDKHSLNLLLRILEGKAVIRVQRLKELTNILERLRKEIAERPTNGISVPPIPASELNGFSPVVSCTKDILATLRAHRILAMAGSQMQNTNKSQYRFCQAIARVLQLPEDSEVVKRVGERAMRAARIRVSKKLQPHEVLSEVSKAQAMRVTSDLSAKQDKLQRLSNTTLALAHLSAHHIASISTFVNSTSHTLRSSLETEAKAIKGHLDVLQWDISSGDRRPPQHGSFHIEVCRVLGLDRDTTAEKVLEVAEKIICEEQARQNFLQCTVMPNTALLDSPHEAILSKHRKDEDRVQEHISKLLARKIEKAKKGDVLVVDVERTAREMSKIVSLSR